MGSPIKGRVTHQRACHGILLIPINRDTRNMCFQAQYHGFFMIFEAEMLSGFPTSQLSSLYMTLSVFVRYDGADLFSIMLPILIQVDFLRLELFF